MGHLCPEKNMKSNRDISILVPAYNEEENLGDVIRSLEQVVPVLTSDYEILIIDDGSTDGTHAVAKRLAAKNTHIRVIRHDTNKGFGITVKDGIAKATKTYITGLPGDNDTDVSLIEAFIKHLGDADLLIGVMDDNRQRSGIRRILSRTFVLLMNTLFGLNLTYYNGYIACKTELLRSIPITSEGFAVFAEIKVRLLSRGVTHKEIPFAHIARKHGQSKAVSWKSFLQTIRTISALVRDRFFLEY